MLLMLLWSFHLEKGFDIG